MTRHTKTAGFTLVELLIAMAFFGFILIFMTTGFIIVNRAYNKGITVKLIQDEGRKLVEELTREIRATSAVDSNANCFVVNGYRYFWTIPFDATIIPPEPPYKLYRDTEISCASPSLDGDEVLVLNERIGVQHMELSSVTDDVYRLSVTLSTAEADLLGGTSGANAECTQMSGSQYCDVVKLTTVISSR